MACLSSATLWKAPRRMRFRVISAKKRSTMLSQEVEVETRMGLEPGRGFMGGVVVNHEMKVEALWGLLIDQLEKAQELAMPMARQAGPDDLAVQHVERGEQSRGAIALVDPMRARRTGVLLSRFRPT